MIRFGSGMKRSRASSSSPMHRLKSGRWGGPVRPGVATGEGDVRPVEAVLCQEITGFHFDKLDQFGVVHKIALVDEHDHSGTPTCRANRMCSLVCGIGPRPPTATDGTVHLRRPGNHVLHVIGMAGTVDVGVVPPFRFILDVTGDDGDGLRFVSYRAALGDVPVALIFARPLWLGPLEWRRLGWSCRGRCDRWFRR